jgi:DNA-binding protein YbaB
MAGDMSDIRCTIAPDAMASGSVALGTIISRNMKDALHQAKSSTADEYKGAMGGLDMPGFEDVLK